MKPVPDILYFIQNKSVLDRTKQSQFVIYRQTQFAKNLQKIIAMAANVPKVTISKGSQTMPLPVIGLGTAAHPQVTETTKSAILDAIETGYRHFDTAFIYGSEQPLGEAIAEAIKTGLIKSRDELFITSKLWCTFASPELVLPAIKTSLKYI